MRYQHGRSQQALCAGRRWSHKLGALALLWGILCLAPPAMAENMLRVLAANTITETGLLDALAREFEANHPAVRVRVEAQGALAVINRAREGHADLVLTHYPPAEELFVDDGLAVARTLVMYNEFALFGPARDPLRLAKERDLLVVLRRLAANQVPFMSPSVRSGTALRMNQLWAMVHVEPDWVGYEVTESSARATLEAAALFGAYTFADMGTYLANRATLRGDLVPLYRDNILLRNYYRALVVSRAALPNTNQADAQAFHDFLISDRGQDFIRRYGEKRHGAQIFMPAAHLDEGLQARMAQAELDERRRNQTLLIVLSMVLALSSIVALVLLQRSRQLERLRRASEERFALAVAGANDGIWDWDLAAQTGFVSARLREILGLPPGSEVVDRPWELLLNQIIGPDRQRMRDWLERLVQEPGGEDAIHVEIEIARPDGQSAWMLVRGRAQRDASGRLVRMTGAVTDVTERRRQAAAMEHQALHDALTGLPNRTLLQERLRLALEDAERSGGTLAIIIMDLDRFKEINDTLGHHVGDQLLQQVCRRLEKIVRASNTVARFGGDEFAILLPQADEKYARHMAQKVSQGLNRLFEFGNHQMYVGGSLVIALYPRHGTDAASLLQHADVAMY